MDITELANSTQAIAQKLGIQKYDIYGSAADSISVQVERGEAKQVKAANRSGVIVRVWNESKTMGVTTTTDTHPKGLELALETALDASFFGVTEYIPDFSPEANNPLPEVPLQEVSPVTAATLIEKLLGAEKDLMAVHPAIESVPYNGLSQQEIKRFYLNSEGSLRQEKHIYSSLYLYAKTNEEGKKPRSAGSYKMSTGLDSLDIAGCVQEAGEKTVSHLNYQKIKTGKYRVVFSGEAFLSLLGAFSNLFNAQSILDKQSLSTPESIGTQIASPLLSLVDDPLHPSNVGPETFDGEGTPTRRTSLIQKGILTGFLHSAGTAKRLNAQPTGHANIGAKVTVSPHFYYVLPGENASQEYRLENAENVIWIDELQAIHAGVSALQGSFSLPFDGWLVNGGDRISIDAATVAGDFLDLLKTIIHVESEPQLTPSGVCPRIWVDNLSITGE